MVSITETAPYIRPQPHIPHHLAHLKGTCPAGMPKRRSECGARARMIAIRTRAALGHRSTGTKTGLRGARLTDARM